MSAATISKEDRKTYGKSGQPIPATKVLVRDMPFDHEGVKTRSWVVINEQEGTRIHVNTYDGKLGRNLSHKTYSYDAEDKKTLRKLRDYREVDVAECPFAVSA